MAAVAAADDADAASALEEAIAAEADAAPASPDERGGHALLRPWQGPGGVQGGVAEITTEYLTVTADDGSTLTFAVDGTTSWVRQEAIDAADVQPGDAVSVQIRFAGQTGADATDDSTSVVATQVTATKPAA